MMKTETNAKNNCRPLVNIKILICLFFCCSLAFEFSPVSNIFNSINHTPVLESILIEGDANDDSRIDLILQFADFGGINPYNRNLYSTVNESQAFVSHLREQNVNMMYQNKHNNCIFTDVEKEGFEISNYAPFALKKYESLSAYNEDKTNIEKLLKTGLIKKAYVSPSLTDDCCESTVLNNPSSTTISLDQAKSLIGVSSSNYSGEGIKIGIIDEGYPSNTANFPSGTIVDYVSSGTSPNHTGRVCSIIGGSTGIAQDSELYIFGCDPGANNSNNYSFFNAVEWLLDKGVNIINMSMYNSHIGYYDGHCAYVDYIVSHNAVSFVKSAGNDYSTKYITNPGMALNAFAVGSIDGDKNVSYFSSFTFDSAYDGIIAKPTLVAPGENITIPNYVGAGSGTSFAAPMVTGCLALLMEQFPQLISSPELAMSAIVNGAKKLPSQTTLWDDNCGAGLLNYPETVSILSDGYIMATVPNNASNGFLAGSRSFSIPARSYVDLSFIHTIRGETTSPFFGSATLAFSKYNIVVTDSNGLTVATSSNNSNLHLLTINNTSYSPTTMTASIYLNGSKTENGTEYSALTFFTHNHVYNHHYINYSSTKHKAYCECGEYVLGLHSPDTLNSYIYNGHVYAPCVFCGALMDLGGNGPIIPVDPFSRGASGS